MPAFISAVIPMRNEESSIKGCIESLLKQDYPEERVELLFVDGASTDNTRDIVEHFSRQYPHLRLLHNPDRTVPYAMNIGIRAAQGDYIVRIDAHSEYASDYFSRCVEYLERTGADNVGGPMVAAGHSRVAEAIAHILGCPFGLGGGKFHDANYEGEVDTVYLGAFKKSTLFKVGLYDVRLTRNQDIELNNRIRKSGGRVYLAPGIKSTYYCRDTIRGLMHQNYANGTWNVYALLLNRSALSLRHFVPLAFVLSLMVLSFGAIFSGTIFRLLLAEVGLYALCNLYFSLQLASQHGFRYFGLYSLVFALLHTSYGMGSLAGMLTLGKQKRKWAL